MDLNVNQPNDNQETDNQHYDGQRDEWRRNKQTNGKIDKSTYGQMDQMARLNDNAYKQIDGRIEHTN